MMQAANDEGMFLFLGTTSTPGFDLEAVRLARTFLLGISAGALAQFGANLLAKAPVIPGAEAPAAGPTLPRLWLRLLPLGLGVAWLGALILIPADYPPGSRQWLIHAEVWARYLLYLPGSLLAGLALISEAGLLDQSYLRRIARDARLAGGALLVNALVSGLVVPSGQHLPLSTITYDGFEAAFGFPVQLLRAAIALAVAYFILRLLDLFRIQSNRRMEQAQKLATLEERERIAREMHDGLAQVIGYLNLKTRLIRQMVGNSSIYPSLLACFKKAHS
jgi:signal transduction histidine kinase